MADYLVAQGVPFRDAHAIVGAIVRQLVAEGRDFASLTLDEWRAFSDRIRRRRGRGHLGRSASVAAKRTPQSTNPDAVRAALDELRGWLGGRAPVACERPPPGRRRALSALALRGRAL